ncbi:C-terminal isoform 3 [Theobroma cacao]|nr:C-terminal isoform 3 [Theobroma cacao]
MNLVRELEIDLKVANVICMNGRRHLTSSINEVSRDLVVNTDSKKKQALMDLLPVLAELLHAQDMQAALESLVEEGNYCKAFQVLSEYLQLLDSVSELSAIQEMSRGVEVWLGRTLQKLDSLLLGVCQEFKEEGYLTVVDAYALIGDVSGLAEKIQSFFMQEVISETHSVLKSIVHEDQDVHMQSSRLTYSDLCLQIPESKFRQCLLRTLAVLFKLMCSYHEIMGFQLENKVLECPTTNAKSMEDGTQDSSSVEESRTATYSADASERTESGNVESHDPVSEGRNDGGATSSSGSPWYQLRKEAIAFVSQTLQRGRKNLWQLTTSRVSVLLSSSAASSTSIHQFLKNYEDLNTFILAGEAFCGVEAVEFRQKLKGVCENYFTAFHRQNISALKMVLEKETWLRLPPETVQIISFAGLVGDGAPLIAASDGKSSNARVLHTSKSANAVDTGATKSGFSPWLRNGNPFLLKVSGSPKEAHNSSPLNGATSGEYEGNVDNLHGDIGSPHNGDVNHINGSNSMAEEENEDLLADFIDEDSQLPSRISKSSLSKTYSSHCSNDEFTAQTGSSLCLLRSMDKYARLMQKLEIVNVEFFKGICQLFEMFFYYIFEAFGQQNMSSSGKGSTDSLTYRLKTALSRITQDCDQWIKTSSGSPLSPLAHTDVTPTVPQSPNFGPPVGTSFGLKERCAGADTVALVARILHRSRTHLQSLLLKSNTAVVEDFFVHLVDSVPDLTEHIHRTTARILLHINGYVDRIANAKWELKELGMEHNGSYYLPETEYIHWARAHPEYSKNQIVGLINLVATMKGWKRKTRLEVLEKIE